jgi:hypothetical protein
MVLHFKLCSMLSMLCSQLLSCTTVQCVIWMGYSYCWTKLMMLLTRGASFMAG